MSKQKYFYLYKITNKINGKYYIGVHQTKNLEDGYMGSGKYLKRAIKKYGIENFEKEILEYFETSDAMFLKEAEIVNEEFVKLKETYNLSTGGYNRPFSSEEIAKGREKYLYLLRNDKEFKENFSIAHTKRLNKMYENGYVNGFKDKKHTEETKRRIGISNSLNKMGEKNPNYGKCWIYNLELKRSIMIKKEELDSYLSLGWIKGNKLKF